MRSKQVPVALYEAARRHFGTWKAAVQEAGLNYEAVTGHQRWMRALVMQQIQKLAAKGEPLDAFTVERRFPALHGAATRLFPRSWWKALEAADLSPADHKRPRGGGLAVQLWTGFAASWRPARR